MTTRSRTPALDAWFAKVPAVAYVRRIEATEPPRPGATEFLGNATERLLRMPSGAFIADPDLWADRIHPEDLGRVLATWRTTTEPDAEYHLEYRMRATDGRVIHVLDDARVVEDPDDHVRRWHGVVVDVTAERDTGPDVFEAEERYRLLVEQLPAVTYIDEVPADDPSDLTPVYISPQIEDMVGYPLAEWLGEGELWLQVLHPDDAERMRKLDEFARRDLTPLSAEYRMVTQSGRVIWVNESASVVVDPATGTRYWQGVMVDVTARKEAELELTAERERTAEVSSERFHRFERRHGSFQRTIGLPDGVKEEDVSADYKNGVLEVHVKKPAQAQPRRIQIGKNDQATIEGTSSKK
jgi:PAS domain S-box-containing protein